MAPPNSIIKFFGLADPGIASENDTIEFLDYLDKFETKLPPAFSTSVIRKLIKQGIAKTQIDRLYELLEKLQNHSGDCFTTFFISDKHVNIRVDSEFFNALVKEGSTGFKVWEAAKLMATFLLQSDVLDQYVPRSGRILELGSGTGFVGLITAKMRPNLQVVLSDMHPKVLSFLTDSIEENDLSNCEVNLVDWFDFQTTPKPAIGAFDLIIGADIVYDPFLFDALVDCLDALLETSPVALLSCSLRNSESFENFCNLLKAKDLQFVETLRTFSNEDKNILTSFLHGNEIEMEVVILKIFK